MTTHQNRLALEPSPYLQQHAGNPVDWYPWGPEALSRARAEDKPILLSIGYSACHWCHVMEHESFEDEAIAELMNRSFISIKVDREERPDLDQIYQTAVQLLGVRGGWPLTVFLTPDLEPFYGGTYFPPTDRYGMPAFTRVLQAVADLYQNRRDEIHKQATQLKRGLDHLARVTEQGEAVTPELLDRAARVFSRSVDPTYGGFHGAPKFPQTMALSFLLRYFHRTQDRSILDQVTLTLRRMAEGGIYDHLGGGFHRYTVDERWFVPHFEKMLYDNALLLALYAEATQLTGDPFFAQIAEEIVTYVLRDMRHPKGGFFATQDADSEGEEGKYYVWTQQEIFTHLGSETGELFCRAYGVTAEGNWEGDVNILRSSATPEQLAKRSGRPPEEVSRLLIEARYRLLAIRERRVKPFRDEKILTGWNGLMISGLAQAANGLGLTKALAGARGAIRFVEAHLMREGKLLRSFKDGQVRLEGTLDDYAFFIQGLLDTAEVTGDVSLVERAQKLAAVMVEEFWDPGEGSFYFVGPNQEDLLFRPKSLHDHAIPAGSAVASQVLLRLARLGGPAEYRTMAEETFRRLHGQAQQNPFALGHLLTVMEMALFPPPDVIIIGKVESPDTKALVKSAHQPFLPNKALLVIPPADRATAAAPHLKDLLAGKGQVDGQATAYVCRNFTCSAPVTNPDALLTLLREPTSKPEAGPEAGPA